MPRGRKVKPISTEEAQKIEDVYITQGLSIDAASKLHHIGHKRVKSYLISTNQLRTKEEDKKQILKNRKKAFLEKYGVDNPMKCREVAVKVSEYHKKNAESLLASRKATMFKKYGVGNPQQCRGIHEKTMKSCRRLKTYTFDSGREVKVQGYEPLAIDILLSEGIKESDMYFGSDVPRFSYNFKGVDRKYFPDIYIKSQNTIVEVKSSYILNQQKDRNEAKFDAVKESSFNFRLIVI